MEKKRCMDVSQRLMMVTENEHLYQLERTDFDYNRMFFQDPLACIVVKEPTVALKEKVAVSTQDLEYVLKVAMKAGAKNITLETATNVPMRVSFKSKDRLSTKPDDLVETAFWVAPYIE